MVFTRNVDRWQVHFCWIQVFLFNATYHLATSAVQPINFPPLKSRLLPVAVPSGPQKTHCRAGHRGQFQTLKLMVKTLKKMVVSIIDTKTGFEASKKNSEKHRSVILLKKNTSFSKMLEKNQHYYSLSDQVDALGWTRCVFNVLRCPLAPQKNVIVYMSSFSWAIKMFRSWPYNDRLVCAAHSCVILVCVW